MGFFSKITRAITKPIKKIIKSPLGKMALMGGLGYFSRAQAGLWGTRFCVQLIQVVLVVKASWFHGWQTLALELL